ncbi:MAG: copper resistance system multicopper oxidase [Pseudohongiellaceae bacterium]
MGNFPEKANKQFISRRKFVTSALAAGAVFGTSPLVLTAQTQAVSGPVTLSGNRFDLNIAYKPVNFSGQERVATVINGSLPAPVLRWREGEEVVLRVTNNLAEDSSVHWHGIILPSNMDGVPGLSFEGIKPGQSYEYRFTINQSGTYWYHSHSGFQEQLGLYGAIIIDPKETEQISYDRDYVVMLSDWSDSSPAAIYSKLRKMGHYYNFNQRTFSDVFQEIQTRGVEQTWNDRRMWNLMRMSDRDIADVTAYTYTYLMNGISPDPGWTGLFNRGEKIRLRFINSAAMSIFDIRIPGLRMTVVAADGQNIEPVTVDEFRIGVAETYDVIVEPEGDRAYALFAQSIDRSGFALGTLTPDVALQAEVPAMDPRPVLTMADMGMAMSGMDMDMSMHDMSMHDMSMHEMDMHEMDMHEMGMPAMEMSTMPMQTEGMAGLGSNQPVVHASTEYSPRVDMRSANPQSGLDDPGIGLRQHQARYNRKVLTYADIKNLTRTIDRREPDREIQLHLTGNMHRYLWSINGIPFADAEALEMTYGERLRITLVNDTMMTHPIHLHGMWSELETGAPNYIPRKHTVLVQPGKKISYLVTADARGRWAYHCHLLYHMSGMFREVKVS